ncbi:MAG TPA: NAD(P)-dependent oxidoreductase, partial [Pirellulales bacterium]|nr:NAD(P)-dependent oxidoreductase [Pirellulales bacterium]
LRRAVERVDRVCHLAAYIPHDQNDTAEAEACYRVNALAMLHLARAAVASGVERLVYVSAANAYQHGHRPATEDDAAFPAEVASYYLTSKLAGEIYLHHACQRSASCAITLRVGTPYGPGEPCQKVIPALLANAARGEPLRLRQGGRPTYNFVYVEDVARCVAAALESGESGIYNVASGQSTTLLALAETIAELYGERSPRIVLEPTGENRFQGFPAISIEKARRTWNLAPLTLREGLQQYCKQHPFRPGYASGA